jgi:protein-L-isoaspartate O-methyltransferase
VELGDCLPVEAGDHLLDIGCGLGGPARYLAQRFECRVTGIDITEPFVEAAVKLTALLALDDRVSAETRAGTSRKGAHIPSRCCAASPCEQGDMRADPHGHARGSVRAFAHGCGCA